MKLGYRTKEAAAKAFDIPVGKVCIYECMECGARYYSKWHSMHSMPEACPVCGNDDELFITNRGLVEFQ